MQEAEQKLLEIHMLLGQATSKQIDIDLKINLLKKTKELLMLCGVSNCGGAIPYDSLSDSFKKSIDSIEGNLNR